LKQTEDALCTYRSRFQLDLKKWNQCPGKYYFKSQGSTTSEAGGVLLQELGKYYFKSQGSTTSRAREVLLQEPGKYYFEGWGSITPRGKRG